MPEKYANGRHSRFSPLQYWKPSPTITNEELKGFLDVFIGFCAFGPQQRFPSAAIEGMSEASPDHPGSTLPNHAKATRPRCPLHLGREQGDSANVVFYRKRRRY